MAKNRRNPITHGQSGKFANICFQKNGVFRSLPDTSNRIWSPLQVKHHQHFANAREYGRRAVADVRLTAHYASLLPNWKRKIRNKNVGVYQIAICDFSHPPFICEVKLTRSHNPPVFCLSVFAGDMFKVEGAFISIFTPDGEFIEEGNAFRPDCELKFQYAIKNSGILNNGTVVRIRIWDVPGNITEKDFSCILEQIDIPLSPL